MIGLAGMGDVYEIVRRKAVRPPNTIIGRVQFTRRRMGICSQSSFAQNLLSNSGAEIQHNGFSAIPRNPDGLKWESTRQRANMWRRAGPYKFIEGSS